MTFLACCESEFEQGGNFLKAWARLACGGCRRGTFSSKLLQAGTPGVQRPGEDRPFHLHNAEEPEFRPLFRHLSGADGIPAGVSFFDKTDGTTVTPYHLTSDVDFDAPHDWFPGLVISPYSKQGYIDHKTYSFESWLKIVEKRFGIALMTDRDRNALDMLDSFDFTQAPRAPYPQAATVLGSPYPLPLQAITKGTLK